MDDDDDAARKAAPMDNDAMDRWYAEQLRRLKEQQRAAHLAALPSVTDAADYNRVRTAANGQTTFAPTADEAPQATPTATARPTQPRLI